MRARSFRRLFSLAVSVWFAAASLTAQKPAQKPADFYLAYVAAAEKMKSIKDVLPYMPADQADVRVSLSANSIASSSRR